MKKKISAEIQLVLGLILLLLYLLFPPNGLGVLLVVPVLGLLGMRFLDNLLAKNLQLSYNWLTLKHGRAPGRTASLPVPRAKTREAAPRVQEWVETHISLALIAWVPTTLAFYFALDNLAQLFSAGLEKTYLLPVGSIYWGVLAMIAGASLALAVSQLGMALALGERYSEYVRHVNQRFGLDLSRAVAWLVAGALTGVSLLIGPGLVTYTRFSVEGIAVHQPFELQERTQSFAQVQHIRFVTVPSQTRRGMPTAYFQIAFADNTEWTSPRFDSRAVPPAYWDAVKYAAQQSQRAIERVAYSEAFTTGAHSWPIGIIDTDEAQATRSISGGKYTWQVESKDNAVLWQAARMSAVSDFRLDLDCQRLDGSAAARCGAILHSGAGDYYMFLIGDDQTISFYLHHHDWVPLIESRANAAVLPNQSNHITVNAVGPHFTFWVNGKRVGEVDDNTLRSGTAGVALQVPASGEATVQFSNLEVVEQ